MGQMLMSGSVTVNRPWLPTDLLNDIVWYVADNPANTTVGGLTTALADKSGRGFTASIVSGSGADMSDSLNGRPVLRISGGNGVFMSEDAGNLVARKATHVSLFAVHRAISLDGAGYPAVASTSFGAGSATLQTALLRSEIGHPAGSINLRTRPGSSDGGIEVNDDTNYGDAWINLGAMRAYGDDSGYIWVNGTEDTYWTGLTASHVTDDVGMSLVIGGYTVEGFDQWTQNIAEVIAVAGDISVDDRQRLEGFFAWGWGLQDDLESDHPYKTGRPMA